MLNDQSIYLMSTYLLLNNIRSLLNVGAIFRTADAVGVKKILLTGATGSPPRHEISKTALGAENTVDWQYLTDSIEAIESIVQTGLKPVSTLIIALEQTKKSQNIFDWPVPDKFDGNLILIVGHEREGIEQKLLDLADVHLDIPMFGQSAKSLNVATATGIALYELKRKYDTILL